MPFTFNGCGTSYYGKRDHAADGSYITTLWVTAVWIPLLPLASYRVRPVGEGTNIIIHSSQSYQVVRVPLCWPQVRNVYLCGAPILLPILYFGSQDIQNWWKQEVVGPATYHSTLQPEPPRPAEPDAPLASKDAALACGKLLKLDKQAFTKLDLMARLSQLVDDSGLSEEELKELGSNEDELEEQAFSAYSLAYLTWDKPTPVSRADLDKIIINAAHSADALNLSPSDRARLDAYLVKLKKMMLKAFDLGRHDARTSPCPF